MTTIDIRPVTGQSEQTEQAEQAEQAEALVERLFGDLLDAVTTYGVYIGDQLGLYRALDKHGEATQPSSPHAPASTRATPTSGSSSKRPMGSSV